jgi:hypothetical protein
VGRIILAKNVSSGALVLATLTRDLGRSSGGWAGRDCRDGCLRRLVVVAAVSREDSSVFAPNKIDGFRDRPDEARFPRLRDCGGFPVFVIEDAVGTAIEAERRAA